MKYVIQGIPTPLLRARHVQYRVYDSQKQLRIHQEIEVQRQIKHEPYKDIALRLDLICYMPFPKSMSVKRRKELLGKPHIIRPDKSNLLKWCEDILVGAGAIYDDCAISYGQQIKIYDYNARTVFNVKPISNEEISRLAQEILKEIES